MNSFKQKKGELEQLIRANLSRLINSDYVLWDLPYHGNIGDILIWQGEIDFLSQLGHKCLSRASKDTCKFPVLSPRTVILLHGGGNFGDIWRSQQEFRLEVIKRYPQNRIIILPQTVYYQNDAFRQSDAEVMAGHPDLWLCARDEISYRILKSDFRNPVMLLPDMAFCISESFIGKWRKKKEERKSLIVRRMDKEGVDIRILTDQIPGDKDIQDWPSFGDKNPFMVIFWKICGLQIRWKNSYFFSFPARILAWGIDKIMFQGVRLRLIKQGVRFISGYRQVYTTRLHVMILSVLLHKPVIFLDNSYGKNSAFYSAWLKDLNEVGPFEKF